MAGLSALPTRPGEVDSYPTTSDVPDDLDPGTVVYVEDEQTLYFEDGS